LLVLNRLFFFNCIENNDLNVVYLIYNGTM